MQSAQERQKQQKKEMVCVCIGAKEILIIQCYGVIGTFVKGDLRITSNDKEFLRIKSIEGDGAR